MEVHFAHLRRGTNTHQGKCGFAATPKRRAAGQRRSHCLEEAAAHGTLLSMSSHYHFEDDLNLSDLLTPLTRAEDRIARLDERLRKSAVASGAVERAFYREAIARMHLEGELVHLDDLVLLDDGSLGRRNSAELSRAFHILLHWRQAASASPASLLRAPRPGEGAHIQEARQSRPGLLYDPEWNEAGRLSAWRDALRSGETLPPCLAAVLVMDAWLLLEPEQRGQWRAPLLASLVLQARAKTRNFVLPISWGAQRHKFRWSSRAELNERLTGLLAWMEAAAEKMDDEANKLTLAREMMHGLITKRRKHSRLHLLADLLVAKPVVSIPMAAKALDVTHEAARLMMKQLGSLPREMTGRSSYRVWGIVQGF